ncbi:YdhK family protein [Corynebacterium liangguodongii]|uniref:YdhK family protein n=1 Tax=Corynebacterium liangguodongii TaxID=2079535 RepID=UPI0018EE7A31|nr:YdhK family protein [Corynebacterium liangguodongii]
MKKTLISTCAAACIAALAGCAQSEPAPAEPDHSAHAEHSEHSEHSGHSGHSGHNHPADGGPVPAGMAEAADPTYPVGTKVTLAADHMPGMEGAPATIVGAYDTTAYAVSYMPTDGSEPVANHKWVVQEEIKGAGKETLAAGTEVTLEADHMPGMKGAAATIDSSTDETVYVVDVEADGMTMTNHKWVVESEIRAS